VVAESRITFPFDINHIPIHTYKHLGYDIGHKEFKAELMRLIREMMSWGRTDSPVFRFLPTLTPHRVSAEQRVGAPPQGQGPTLNQLKRQARDAMSRSDFETATDLWQRVRDGGPKDDYVVQQLALATYKSKRPTEIEALKRARKILKHLWPAESLDPETLGL
jgi:hypothetical protein